MSMARPGEQARSLSAISIVAIYDGEMRPQGWLNAACLGDFESSGTRNASS